MAAYMMICALVAVIGAMTCTIQRICNNRLVSRMATILPGILSLWLFAIVLGFVDLGVVFPAICSAVAVVESVYCNSESGRLARLKRHGLRNGLMAGLIAFTAVYVCNKGCPPNRREGVPNRANSAGTVKRDAMVGEIEKSLDVSFAVGVPEMPGLPVKEKSIPLPRNGFVQPTSIAIVSDGAPRPIENKFFDHKFISRRKEDNALYEGDFYRFYEGAGAIRCAMDAADGLAKLVERALGRPFFRREINWKPADPSVIDADRRLFQFSPDHVLSELRCDMGMLNILISTGITDNGRVLLVFRVSCR